jgi:flagellar biosynthesis protein FliR
VTTLRLPTEAGTQSIAYLLVFCRIGGLFALAPIFSGRLIPVRAKLVVAAALALAIAPLATNGVKVSDDPAWLTAAISKEIVVGLGFAFAVGAVGAAVQAAATLLDTLVGFSLASLLDPITNQQNAILGQLYTLVTTCVFLLTGGDRLMIAGLAASYRVVPLGSWSGAAPLASLAGAELGQIFVIGIELAAPVLVTVLLVDGALALMARAVPQMNVFVVGMPAKILAALAVVGASLPFAAMHVQDDLANAIDLALHSLGTG